MLIRLCILLVGYLLPFAAHSQQYQAYARRYGVADGLPHRDVHSVFQDRRGFIWVATSGGIARFDGRTFRVFNQMEDGLHSDLVDCITEDADGNIWISQSSGNHWVDIIDPITGKVTSFDEFFKEQSIPFKHVKWRQHPLSLADGTLVIWLEEINAFMTYHPRTGWRASRIENATYSKLVHTTSRRTLWCIFRDAATAQDILAEINLDGKLIRQFAIDLGHYFGLLKGPSLDPDGFFIFDSDLTHGALALWEIDGQGQRTISAPRFPKMASFQYAVLEQGNLIVQFPYIHHSSGELLLDITQEYADLDAWQYNDFLVDRSGNLWFATNFGLIIVELRKRYFQRLLYDDQASGDRGTACRALTEINGRLLVNSDNNHVGGRFSVDLNSSGVRRLPGAEYALSLVKSFDGNLWTEWKLKSNDAKTGLVSLQKITPEGDPIGLLYQTQTTKNGFIWSMLEESPTRLLLGMGDGLLVLNPTSAEFAQPANSGFPEFDHACVNSLQRDRSGQIWACTSQGLYRLRESGEVSDRYWSGGQGDHYLPYDNIFHFYEDTNRIFWLGTAGGGLIKWDQSAPAERKTQIIFRKNGLLNGVIYAVYEDRHQHLWLPTDFGIAQLDKTSLRVRHTWLKADGITHNEFNRLSHGQGADGTLYFGGLNGVTAFHPDDFYNEKEEQNEPPSLVPLALQIYDGKSGRLEDRLPELLTTNAITLHSGDRYVQFEFALLDFIAPDKVTYYWFLDGVTADWEVLNEPLLRLPGLPYGTYQLRLRAQASNSVWANNELTYSFHVPPPFYLRWWFIVLNILILALSVWIWIRWRIREHRLKQERLEKEVARQTATILHQTEELKRLDQAKSRFFANITHELRTPLTLILGPIGTILKSRRLNDPDRALATIVWRQGQRLMTLINEILDLSKLESGAMQIHETVIPLYPFLLRITNNFQSHAERLGIDFRFEYGLPKELNISTDSDKVEKVLNNLLSNAFKYTPTHAGNRTAFRVNESEGNILFQVSDTGAGIHPDDLPLIFDRFFQTTQPGAPIEGGSGIGLALCRELAQVLNGQLRAESQLGVGSDFYFEIPKNEVIDPGKHTLPESDEPDMIVPFLRPESTSPPPGAPRILVVEDHESLRDYIRLILADTYEVVATENGLSAISCLEKTDNPPDLILSDVMMPQMDGFQLLEKLKGDDRYRHIPVVMLTARAELHDKLRALRIGVDDYLLKPFEEDELLARISNLLLHAGRRISGKNSVPAGETPDTAFFSADDLAWLEQFEKVVERRLPHYELTAELLAGDMAMSRSTLFRQLKRLTGLTPMQYIDEARFQKARLLLETRAVSSVKAAAYAVGFKQVKHFSLNYKKRFGKLPSEG